MKIKVGMRVVGVGECDGLNIDGLYGKIVDTEDYRNSVGVEFEDLNLRGHDCNGKGRDGFCWYIGRKNFKISLKNNEEGIPLLHEDLWGR